MQLPNKASGLQLQPSSSNAASHEQLGRPSPMPPLPPVQLRQASTRL